MRWTVWLLLVPALLRAEGDSLCRLDFFSDCSVASEVLSRIPLSDWQKGLFSLWATRYGFTPLEGAEPLLALSDLPRAVRHHLFLHRGRPLSRNQVIQRLASLGVDGEEHPVFAPLLQRMADAFGGERLFYAGLEKALHQVVVEAPWRAGEFRKRFPKPLEPPAVTFRTEGTRRPPAQLTWEAELPPKAPGG